MCVGESNEEIDQSQEMRKHMRVVEFSKEDLSKAAFFVCLGGLQD